jgi:hypothetical protein
MTRMLSRGRLFLFALLGLVLLTGVVLWLNRGPLLRSYYLNGLAEASAEDREVWVERVVSLDTEAVPGLLRQLERPEAEVCGNAGAAMTRLTEIWGWKDERTLALAEQIHDGFSGFSAAGQEAVLKWEIPGVKDASTPGPVRESLVAIFGEAGQRTEPGIRKQALVLAHLLLDQNPTPECQNLCRSLVARELTATEPEMRMEAIHLSVQEVFQDDFELLKQVVPLLKDSDAQVRRLAVLAVGALHQVIQEDALLPMLHDSDADVRRLCEGALRSRGLHDSHIFLGKLITDSRPQQRMKVFQHLRSAIDLEPGIWLERLSKDESPAVRAAAVREAVLFPDVDFSARLREIAQTDPSPTVQQLAVYYLKVSGS